MRQVIHACVLTLCIGAAAAGTRAGAQGPDDLKPMVQQYWKAWQAGPDQAEPLYAKDADLVFYDLEPVKYAGWTQYKAGVVPNILSKFASIAFTVNDDVKTTRRGDLAWTSATVKGDGTLKGGAPLHVIIRHTAIWERRGTNWLIVHEHVSVPSALPTAPK